MGRIYICSEGHSWERDVEAASPDADLALRCPTCGSAVQLMKESPAAPLESGALPSWGTAAVDFTLAGKKVHAEFHLPAGPVRPRLMLPVLQKLTDFVVDEAVKAVEAKGAKVSCQKGCGACCRQLVPITEMEAYHIRDLVARLPEPRRSQIRDRFAHARQRLQVAGLLEAVQGLGSCPEREIDSIGMSYFELHIPCPFLEEESCSIHQDRPLVCREYLVTSPAENCGRPREGAIDGVPLGVKVSKVVAHLGETEPNPRRPFVPLVLAPEWADAHPNEPPPRPAPDLLQEVFHRLAKKPDS
jgi:Fe-S-cluster containining protein